MSESFLGIGRIIGPYVWPLLAVAAIASFVVVDALAVLADLEASQGASDLSRWRALAAPLVANFCLIAVVLAIVLFMPWLVRRRSRADGRLHTLLVLAGLGLLSLNTIRTAAPAGWLLDIQNLIFPILYAFIAVVLARSAHTGGEKTAGLIWLAGLALPHVWRLVLQWGSTNVVVLQRLADWMLVVGLIAVTLVAARVFASRRLALIAAVPAVALAVLLFTYGDDTRAVVGAATRHWLMTIPPALATVLLPAALFAAVRMSLEAFVPGDRAVLGLSILLQCCAGFLPLRAESLLVAFTALVLFHAWAAGTRRTRADLVDMVS